MSLKAGDKAPSFTGKDQDGNTVNLSDFKGKWVVLFFYPLDFTFVCPTELTQFRDSVKEFKAAGAEILGCSIDSVHSHKKWLKDDLGNLNYPLLAEALWHQHFPSWYG